MTLVQKVEAGQKIDLSQIDAGTTAGLEKKAAVERLAALGEELAHLQQLLYAAGTHSVLVVLQGMDTSGKDGVIRHVFTHMNPEGCHVESFKAPTADELAHDFLWRVHRATPGRGNVTVFNRSHYEDVLIARVHNLVPREVWQERYAQINDFEKLLLANKTIVLKFFLHISKDEQEKRLLAREQEIEKAWKLSPADWQERNYWDDYQAAYKVVLEQCSTQAAPWLIVPANKKWFRNIAVAEAIVEALRPFEGDWTSYLSKQSKLRVEELKRYRAGLKKSQKTNVKK